MTALFAKSRDLKLASQLKERMEGIVRIDSGWASSKYLETLREASKELAEQRTPSALIEQQIDRIENAVTLIARAIRLGFSLATHSLLWLLLWFGYPRSRSIQAIFFWNKWVPKCQRRLRQLPLET
jgi:hypothetical protein